MTIAALAEPFARNGLNWRGTLSFAMSYAYRHAAKPIRFGVGDASLTLSTPITPEVANKALSFIQNPDALYTAAINGVSNSIVPTEFQGEFSDIAKKILDAAKQAVFNSVGTNASSISTALTSAVTDALGPDVTNMLVGVAADVASMVSDIIPVIGFAFSAVMSAVSMIDTDNAAMKVTYLENMQALFKRPLVGHGYNGSITPADLFAYEPEWRPQSVDPKTGAIVMAAGTSNLTQGYPFMPSTILGMVLACITEDNAFDWSFDCAAAQTVNQGSIYCDARFTDGSYDGLTMPTNVQDTNLSSHLAFVKDSNLHHASYVLDTVQSPMNNSPIKSDRRKVYQLLRRAMGSENSDHGIALWPLYMDMLSADWDALYMNGAPLGPAATMLTWVFGSLNVDILDQNILNQGLVTTDPGGLNAKQVYNLMGSAVPWGYRQMVPFLQQIDKMVQFWRSKRNTLPALLGGHIMTTGQAAQKRKALTTIVKPKPAVPLSAPSKIPAVFGGLVVGAVLLYLVYTYKHRKRAA